MSVLTKRDLKYTYHWNIQPNNDLLKGALSSNSFNKREGYEVLYIINAIAKLEGYSKSDALEIEKIINRKLHENYISQCDMYRKIKELYDIN